MSLVLNIDTTSEAALANIAENGVVLLEERNAIQNNHAAFLHPALQSLLHKTGKALKDIDAVAVSHGPGFYTDIRVGTAAAKGLCYAAGKPLIVVGQLELLAQDAIANSSLSGALYCPMIDARRMEVFAAVYCAIPTCCAAVRSSSVHEQRNRSFPGRAAGLQNR